MLRIRIALVSATCALALVPAAPAEPEATRLTATVGPGFTITLKLGTKKVTRLKPGTYTFVVRDRSDDHNFHLRGPGVNKATGIEFTGTKTFTIKLRKGTYRYVCDPHAGDMRGSVRVG